MAQAGLTVRRTCRTDAKAGHNEPMVRIRCGQRLSNKSYSGDNRLVPPKSPYRRRSSAPRLTWAKMSRLINQLITKKAVCITMIWY